MELFEDNSTITILLPQIINQCILKKSNYEIFKTLDTDDDLFHQFVRMVDEKFEFITIKPDKNLQLMMICEQTYVDALQLLHNNDIIRIKNGIFKIIYVNYYRRYSGLQIFLLKYGIKLDGKKLIHDPQFKLIYSNKQEILVDLNNWYCECDDFSKDCYTNFSNYTTDNNIYDTKYPQTNFITTILKNCRSKLPNQLPICCHILALLIIEGNQTKEKENYNIIKR